MSILSSLFNNEAIKKAAFGTLKKQIVDNDIKLGVFFLDASGEIDVVFHKDAVEIVKSDDLAELRRVYNLYVTGELIEPAAGDILEKEASHE